MKLTNSQRDKRIIRILIPFGIIFCILAAFSGEEKFLFSLIFVGTFWFSSQYLQKRNWYHRQATRHKQGNFVLFPLVQFIIIVALVFMCSIVAYFPTRLLTNGL
jgi:hypothetical protein